MDLPPIIPPITPIVPAGTLPLPASTPNQVNQRRLLEQQEAIQQAQRPSLSYLIFLSILFFFLNNRNEKEFIHDTTTIDSIKSNLRIRELRRDGLANWLGVNTTFIHEGDLIGTNSSITNNGNTSIPIEFKPKPLINPIILPRINQLLERKSDKNSFHHQNLTGLIRGDWKSMNLSLEGLGLSETFNTTTSKEMPIEVPPEKELLVETEGVEVEKTVAVDVPLIAPRAPVDRIEEVKNATILPKTHLVNVTETTNRTEIRGKFKWLGSGKASFNLKEERSSVTGARKQVGLVEDGQLVRQKVGEMEKWELEGPVSYLRVSLLWIVSFSGYYAEVLISTFRVTLL